MSQESRRSVKMGRQTADASRGDGERVSFTLDALEGLRAVYVADAALRLTALTARPTVQ